MIKSFLSFLFLLLALTFEISPAFSARLFPGYAGVRWGTDVHAISQAYRNGTLGKIGDQFVYIQANPNQMMRQRTFGFEKAGLNAVSVTFSGAYVKNVGVETILKQCIKQYGSGLIDRSSAPHLISYLWQDGTTRITFAYAPERPELTVLMFQKK